MTKPATNILLVIDSLNVGGAQTQLILLANELSKRNCYVDIFTYHDKNHMANRLDGENIQLLTRPRTGKSGVDTILKLRATINSKSYGAIVAYMYSPNLLAGLARALSTTTAHLIISYRSCTQFNKLSRLQLFSRYLSNRLADSIVSNSFHERNRWQKRFPAHANKWTTIYNGIPDKGQRCIRERTGQLLVVGSVSQNKNGMLLVKALKQLLSKKNLSNLVVNWIGRKDPGIEEANPSAEAIEIELVNSGLESKWNWHGEQDEVLSFYLQADVLIHMSWLEGLPNVVCEAQMTGCPVILSKVLDHPNMINHGQNGFLFDPNQSERLVECVEQLYKLEDDSYQRMCNASREKAMELYNIDSFADSYYDLIQHSAP